MTARARIAAIIAALLAGGALAWATHPLPQRVVVTVAPSGACGGLRVEVGQ